MNNTAYFQLTQSPKSTWANEFVTWVWRRRAVAYVFSKIEAHIIDNDIFPNLTECLLEEVPHQSCYGANL